MPPKPVSLLETVEANPQLVEQYGVAGTRGTIHLPVWAAAVYRRVDGRHSVPAPRSGDVAQDGGTSSDRAEHKSQRRPAAEGQAAARSYAETIRNLPGRRVGPSKPIDSQLDYRLVGELGRGGTGIVYQANQTAVQREVAIKFLRQELSSDDTAQRRFLREARAIGSLDHPNVIALHEVAVDGSGRPFYSMKRILGTAWSEVLAEKTQGESLQIWLRVADALRYAHSRGVLHRDIKPENVMLGPYGEVLLADWGLAVFYPRDGADSTTDSIGGTPAYMAPELATGDIDAVDPRTDVYLLGGILFHLLAGRPPHFGNTVIECIRAAAENRIQPTDVNGELMEIARRALQTDPRNRFQDVETLQAAVRDYLQHEESHALVRRARRRSRSAIESGDYEQFGLALALLQDALEIWSGNRAASNALIETRLRYGRLALANGDIDLAETLLNAAGGAAVDPDLKRRVDDARHRSAQKAAKTQRVISLFDNSPDCVLLTRLSDGTILEANATFLLTLGYEPHEVIGQTSGHLQLFVCPERREQALRSLRGSGRIDNFEADMRRRDGTAIAMLLSSRLVEEQGEQLVVTHARDITTRRRAEQELRRSEAWLKEAQRLAHLGLWQYHPATGRLEWTEETARIAGVQPADSPDNLEEYFETVHPEERERVRRAITDAIEQGRGYQMQIRHRRPDGTFNAVLAHGQPVIENGRTIELRGTILDITERRAMEDRLKSQVRSLQALLDWTDSPLLAASSDGTLLAASAVVCKRLGRDRVCRSQIRIVTADGSQLARSPATVTCTFMYGEQVLGDPVEIELEPVEGFESVLRGRLVTVG